MRVRYLRSETVISLRKSIKSNLSVYRSGRFGDLELDSSHYRELNVAYNQEALGDLCMPTSVEKFEVENSLAIHNYLENITPYEARDERLWVHLTHTHLLEYARARWPIPADDAVAEKHIATHFFARSKRQIERDNAVSRMWWNAHLCTRVSGISQREALEAFLDLADVRSNVIDRPTLSQASNVFGVIIKSLVASRSDDRGLLTRQIFRRVMMDLNSIGGYRLLDALPEALIQRLFDEVLSSALKASRS